jgi:hypothetical protein
MEAIVASDLMFPNALLQQIDGMWLFASVFKYEDVAGTSFYKGVVAVEKSLPAVYIGLSAKFLTQASVGFEEHALQIIDSQIEDELGRAVADSFDILNNRSKSSAPVQPEEVLTPAILDEIEIPEASKFFSWLVDEEFSDGGVYQRIKTDLAEGYWLNVTPAKIKVLHEIQEELPSSKRVWLFSDRGLSPLPPLNAMHADLFGNAMAIIGNSYEPQVSVSGEWWVPIVPTHMTPAKFPVFDHMLSQPDCPRSFDGGEWLVSDNCVDWQRPFEVERYFDGRPVWMPDKILKFARYA